MLHITDIVKYSINLLWLNQKLTDQRYIVGNNKDELVKRLLEPGILWATANPDGHVNIWYDSKAITEDAKKNTQKVLYELAQDHHCANIHLRDIREIPIVQHNPDIFSANLPVYFRIDILKAIFLVHAIETEHMDAALFTDLEIGDGLSVPVKTSKAIANVEQSQNSPKRIRMNKSSLFSEQTLKKLEEIKLLVSCSPRIKHDDSSCSQPENQFLLLIADNTMIEAIKTVIINVNLERAMHMLNMEQCHLKERLYSDFSELTYKSTAKDVFPYYHALIEGVFPLKLINYITDKEETYYPPTNGYAHFGFDQSITPNTNYEHIYFADTTKGLPAKIIEKPASYDIYNRMPAKILYNKKNAEDLFLTAKEIGANRGGRTHRETPESTLIPPISGDVYRCSFWDPINTTMGYGSPVIAAYQHLPVITSSQHQKPSSQSNNMQMLGTVALFPTVILLLAKTLKLRAKEKTPLSGHNKHD